MKNAIILLTVLLAFGCSEFDNNEIDAPNNLVITKVSDDKIKLEWDYNTQGHSYVYIIGRREGESLWNDAWYTTDDGTQVFVDDIPTDSYEVYAYKVKALNQDDETASTFSEYVAWFSPESAPTDLVLTQTSEFQVTLTWKDNAVGEDGYKIDKRIGNGSWHTAYDKLDPDVETFSDSVEFAVPVSYRVYAFVGLSSSAYLAESLDPSFPAPDSLTVEQLSQAQVRLRWVTHSEGHSGIEIERRLGEMPFTTLTTLPGADVTEHIDYLDIDAAEVAYRVRSYAPVEDSEDILYSAYSSIGSILYNIDDIGTIELPGPGTSVAVQDNHAFVAAEYNGLQIIDITNPSLPASLGFIALSGRTTSVIAAEDLVFAANYDGGVHVLDFSDVTAPLEYTNNYCETNGIPYDLAFYETDTAGYLFVADGAANLLVIRLATETFNAMQVARYNTPGVSYGLDITGNTLYLADGGDGVKKFDITDPTNPLLIAESGFIGEARDVKVRGSEVFVAAGEAGLVVLDSGDLSKVRDEDTPGFARSIGFNQRYVYLADSENGMVIQDALGATDPVIMATVPAESNARCLLVHQHLVYLVTEQSLRIIQVIP